MIQVKTIFDEPAPGPGTPWLVGMTALILLGAPLAGVWLAGGDWRSIASFMAAALVCGFFWEMWNTASLARWEYSIPRVDRFRVFEMPLLGYAGYLPFGIECAAIAALVLRK